MSARVRCFLLLGCLGLVSLVAPRASATLHEDVARAQDPRDALERADREPGPVGELARLTPEDRAAEARRANAGGR